MTFSISALPPLILWGIACPCWLDDRAPEGIQPSAFAGCNYALENKQKKKTNKKQQPELLISKTSE